jgi:two-component system response regulator YesN
VITVILADDEPIIVRGLKKIINWKKLNIQIVGTAFNGLEALQLVREKDPDILISDINMPEMTGIDLLRALKNEKSRTQVIFISGFHEFEYAHAALKYGAKDYLLKPINEKQLEQAIMDSVNRENQFILREEHQVTSILKINELIAHEFPMDLKGFFSIVNCQIKQNSPEILNKGEKNILHFSSINLIKDFLSNLENHWIIEENNNIFLLLYHKEKDSLIHLQNFLFDKIVNIIKDNLNEIILISAGKIVDTIKSINKSYETSLEVMNLRYYYGTKAVLRYVKRVENRYTIEDLFTEQSKIIDSLQKSDREIKYKVDCYLKVLKDISFGKKEVTLSYCLGTLLSIKKIFDDQKFFSPTLLFNEKEILKELNELESFEKLCTWMNDFINKIFEDIRKLQDEKIHRDIHKIKSYIADHYNENIKLQDLSNLIYLHPNYLSGYFKKQTGQNFKDYLTEIRMIEAEKLLLYSDLKVYEIAEHVGFTDYRHFSSVFKKKFDINPGEYKKRI